MATPAGGVRDATGAHIRALRKARSLTQAEFAALGGVSKTTQRNYESGKHKPNFEYLQKLADTGIDVVYLLTGRRDSNLLGKREAQILELVEIGQLLEAAQELISDELRDRKS